MNKKSENNVFCEHDSDYPNPLGGPVNKKITISFSSNLMIEHDTKGDI